MAVLARGHFRDKKRGTNSMAHEGDSVADTPWSRRSTYSILQVAVQELNDSS